MPLIVRKFAYRHFPYGENVVITIATSIFFQIGFNLAGKQQRQEISVEFNFVQNRINSLGVICP